MDDASDREQLGALLRELRALAVSRIGALDAAMAELRVDRGADTADDEHDPDGVPLSGEWARLEAVSVSAVQELADIDQALVRWDAGDYGICIDCGRRIPLARLRARPSATRCVDCAERAGR